MNLDKAKIGDKIESKAGFRRGEVARERIVGHGTYVLRGPDGKVKQRGEFENLITRVGDQMYGERGAGLGAAPDAPTGMRLGDDDTAPTKTGAGAAIVSYVEDSAKELDANPGTTLEGEARRITYVVTWGAGVATADGIVEAVITNEDPVTDIAGSAANTISRALLAPVVNKGADDTLEVTWHHDLEGAEPE